MCRLTLLTFLFGSQGRHCKIHESYTMPNDECRDPPTTTSAVVANDSPPKRTAPTWPENRVDCKVSYTSRKVTPANPSKDARSAGLTISVDANTDHIWKGNIWSTVECKVVLHRDPIFTAFNSERRLQLEASLRVNEASLRVNESQSSSRLPEYESRVDVEDTYSQSTSRRELVKFQFGGEPPGATVAVENLQSLRQEYCLTVKIHQDIFREGSRLSDYVALEVDAIEAPGAVLAVGCSPPIIAMEYALSIEERFRFNKYVARAEEYGSDYMTFHWFNKVGGENAGIDVIFHLRDSLGRIVNDYPTAVTIKPELVYDDGSKTPLMPKVPLQERRTSTPSRNPLFRPMRRESELVLAPNLGSLFYAFRIEEVSKNHAPKKGFKLKISVEDHAPHRHVRSAVLDETIVVLSKPKPNPMPRLRPRPKPKPTNPSKKVATSSKDLQRYRIPERHLISSTHDPSPQDRPRKVSLSSDHSGVASLSLLKPIAKTARKPITRLPVNNCHTHVQHAKGSGSVCQAMSTNRNNILPSSRHDGCKLNDTELPDNHGSASASALPSLCLPSCETLRDSLGFYPFNMPTGGDVNVDDSYQLLEFLSLGSCGEK